MFPTDGKGHFELMYHASQAFPISNGGTTENFQMSFSFFPLYLFVSFVV